MALAYQRESQKNIVMADQWCRRLDRRQKNIFDEMNRKSSAVLG